MKKAKKLSQKIPRLHDIKPKTTWQKFAFVIIIICISCDFFSLENLFEDMYNYDIVPSVIYAITLCCFLEGVPVFFGYVLGEFTDKTKISKNENRTLFIGFITFLLLLIVVLSFVISMRYMSIRSFGGPRAFFSEMTTKPEGDEQNTVVDFWGRNDIPYGAGNPDIDNNDFISHLYMLILPVFTSFLAFGVSYVSFRNSKLEKAKSNLEVSRIRYNYYFKAFNNARLKSNKDRRNLWAALSDNGSYSTDDQMPTSLDEFQRQCSVRTRKTIINNCLISYPSQLKRYSTEMESVLTSFISRMSAMSTRPDKIDNLSLEDIIQKHDGEVEKNYKNTSVKINNKWRLNESEELELTELFRKRIDNVVADIQFEHSI